MASLDLRKTSRFLACSRSKMFVQSWDTWTCPGLNAFGGALVPLWMCISLWISRSNLIDSLAAPSRSLRAPYSAPVPECVPWHSAVIWLGIDPEECTLTTPCPVSLSRITSLFSRSVSFGELMADFVQISLSSNVSLSAAAVISDCDLVRSGSDWFPDSSGIIGLGLGGLGVTAKRVLMNGFRFDTINWHHLRSAVASR